MNRMKITRRQLRRIIESAFESPDRGQITSMPGMDRFGDHRTFFDKVKQANQADPGTIDLFIDWAYEAAEISLPEWTARSKEAKWVGMDEFQWENLWHYVEEMGPEAFIKKIM